MGKFNVVSNLSSVTLTLNEAGDEIKTFLNNKDKAIPLQTWTSPEGSRKLRLPDFKTVGT
jgi:hypothetical protein